MSEIINYNNHGFLETVANNGNSGNECSSRPESITVLGTIGAISSGPYQPPSRHALTSIGITGACNIQPTSFILRGEHDNCTVQIKSDGTVTLGSGISSVDAASQLFWKTVTDMGAGIKRDLEQTKKELEKSKQVESTLCDLNKSLRTVLEVAEGGCIFERISTIMNKPHDTKHCGCFKHKETVNHEDPLVAYERAMKAIG